MVRHWQCWPGNDDTGRGMDDIGPGAVPGDATRVQPKALTCAETPVCRCASARPAGSPAPGPCPAGTARTDPRPAWSPLPRTAAWPSRAEPCGLRRAVPSRPALSWAGLSRGWRRTQKRKRKGPCTLRTRPPGLAGAGGAWAAPAPQQRPVPAQGAPRRGPASHRGSRLRAQELGPRGDPTPLQCYPKGHGQVPERGCGCTAGRSRAVGCQRSGPDVTPRPAALAPVAPGVGARLGAAAPTLAAVGAGGSQVHCIPMRRGKNSHSRLPYKPGSSSEGWFLCLSLSSCVSTLQPDW